mmetsp:Transcript_9089/g.12920  ORF Transcript_9089/g.12920 Transcript_9089/m.12920 type:complete len:246 (+) Transcript_9089:62-799(+)
MVMESTSSEATGTGSAASTGAMVMIGTLINSAKDKFNNVGGGEIVSSITSVIPKGTQDVISDAKSKFFNLSYLRTPSAFFGFGEEKPFYFERTPSLILPRLRHNFSFFYLNYFVITTTLFFLTLLISPGTLTGIAILIISWFSVIRATKEGSITVKGLTITQKQAFVVMSIFSAFVLVYLLSNIFWWTLGSSGFLVGMHAIFRDASMHKDEEDKIEMTGDMSGDDKTMEPFLNSNLDQLEDIDVA